MARRSESSIVPIRTCRITSTVSGLPSTLAMKPATAPRACSALGYSRMSAISWYGIERFRMMYAAYARLLGLVEFRISVGMSISDCGSVGIGTRTTGFLSFGGSLAARLAGFLPGTKVMTLLGAFPSPSSSLT